MAKVWKKLQRADSAFEGNVTGTVDGTAAGTVKSGAVAGVAAKVITDAAFDGSTKLKAANAVDALVNSNTTKSDVGLGNVDNDSTSTIRSGTTKGNVGLGSVDNDSTATIRSGTTAGNVGLGNVANETRATILGGNLTGTMNSIAVATVSAGAAKGSAAPVTFRQDGIPTALNAGDTWFDSNDSNKQYRATATGDDAITSGEWVSVVQGKIHSYSKGDVGLGSVDNDSTSTIRAGTTAANVGLGSVNNTADSAKPVSTAQATSIALRAPIASPTFTGTVAGVSATHVGLGSVSNITTTAMREGVTKGNVGLGSVDNTADSAKPVSSAQATSIALRAPIASPTFTGTVAGVSATHVGLGSVSNISTATMRAGVTKANVGLTNVADASIATIMGNNLTGTFGGSTLAETKAAAVATAESNIIGGAPGALNTLNELAAAMNDDASFNSTITTSIATKGKAPMTLTAEDVDGDSTYDNNPASESVGQIGVYSGQSYAVMDI